MLLFPPHSTLRSIIAAAVRNGNFKSTQEAIVRLGKDVPLDGYLGEHAGLVGVRFFQDPDAGEILARNHSHFGLFGNLLARADADELQTGLIRGDRAALSRARLFRAQGTLESMTLRRCPQCVDEDMATYGLSHWRLYHQWPVAHHCVFHGCDLEDACAGCGHQISRGVSLALPHDACEMCGGHEFVGQAVNEPPLYRPTLQCMRYMLTGCMPMLEPSLREARARDAIRALYQQMHLGGLVGLVCDRWNCDAISELAALFGCADPEYAIGLGDIEGPDALPALLVVAVATMIGECA